MDDLMPIDVLSSSEVSRREVDPWHVAGSRLIRRFLPSVRPEAGRSWREPLLDHPEVELGFVSGEGSCLLAEMVFPATWTFPQAKRFLFTQLGEVLLQPIGEGRISEWSDHIIVYWPGAERLDGVPAWVELDAGVKECVRLVGWRGWTAAVEFDRSLGWTPARVAAWLAEHLPEAQLRTARPHILQPQPELVEV